MSLTKPHSQQILHVPVEVGRVARSQYDKNQDAVSLLDFGFVAGEASDNADAWTRLANEVNAQQEGGGLRILVPPGVWRTTVQPPLFTQQVSLIGSGAGQCMLYFDGCGGIQCDLSGLTRINATSRFEGVAFLTSGVFASTLTGLRVKGKQTFAPHLPVFSINDCAFSGYVYWIDQTSAAQEWATALHVDNADEVAIYNFYAKGAWNSAVYASMSDSVGIRVSTSTGVRIYSPQVYLTGHGIKSDGESEGLIIENPTIVSVKRGVRHVDATGNSGNLVIRGGHFNVLERGIEFDPVFPATGSIVSDNFILGNGATSNDWIGIDLAAASWSHIHNNRIFANSAGAVSDVGVRVASLSNHNVIANNGFRNQATCLKVEGGLNLVDANYSEVGSDVLIAQTGGTIVGLNHSRGATQKSVNYGTATMLNGNTSILVAHGLRAEPEVVTLTLQNNQAGGRGFWISAKNANSFTIATNVAVAADAPIFWEAKVGATI